MKPGSIVDVHFYEGCKIGMLISDEGETVTVEFDNVIMSEIPKRIVTLWY